MDKRGFARAAWRLAGPYWFSKERAKGLALLAAVVALALGIVWLNVQFNSWNNDFYNAIQEKKQADFYRLLGRFTLLAFGYIAAGVYQLYLQQMLQIEWRTWLNEHLLSAWLGEGAYYRLQLVDRGTDNPDQRIAEDLRLFVDATLTLALGLLSAVVTLASFVAILWTLSGALQIGAYAVPGYMVWFALGYAIVGTWLTHLLGRPLIGLQFGQQRYEADYRFALVRLRENAEGVALYRGEDEERANFRARYSNVIGNWWAIMRKRKQLGWFTSAYGQLAIIFPFVVAAPRYFSGQIMLGGLMQTASAFGQVQGALSWFVDAYTQFAAWKATVDRLTGFQAQLDEVRADAQRAAGERSDGSSQEWRAEALTLELPRGRRLLEATDLRLQAGESTLLTGPTGAGKSTLFRVLAGIWPFWSGRVQVPSGARVLFLPQKPYLPIGTLAHVLCYPDDAARRSPAELAEILDVVGLGQLAADLDRSENWSQLLSGGEQQRVAFARALLYQPDWLFMDEATAALPEDAKARLYRLLAERLPRTTVVSIGHRSSLAAFHARQLAWKGTSLG
ncbi:MAG: ABC transporter ATP-binding protein/permease [Burkholderiales bacterium]